MANEADELVGVEEALRNLVAKLELIHRDPAYVSVWTMYMIHGGIYKGPQYDQELTAAKQALVSPSGAASEREKYNRHRSIEADRAFAHDALGKITDEQVAEAGGTYGGWKRLALVQAQMIQEEREILISAVKALEELYPTERGGYQHSEEYRAVHGVIARARTARAKSGGLA